MIRTRIHDSTMPIGTDTSDRPTNTARGQLRLPSRSAANTEAPSAASTQNQVHGRPHLWCSSRPSRGKANSATQANWRSMRWVGWNSSLIIAGAASVEPELRQVLAAVHRRQVLLGSAADDEVLQHQHV